MKRFGRDGIYSNSQMRTPHLKKFCCLSDDARGLMEAAMQKLGLSARAYTRILKVARTIADLSGTDNEGVQAIGADHVSEAIQCRSLDRRMEN